MKKKLIAPTIENVLRLFGLRLNDFKGESKRSYQKAYSSFQVFVISHYQLSEFFTSSVVENWIVDNYIQGLSPKTILFYLEKISSLYTKIAHKLEGGRSPMFKELKKRLKSLALLHNHGKYIKKYSDKIRILYKDYLSTGKMKNIMEKIIHFASTEVNKPKEDISFLWSCVALNSGIRADEVKSIIGIVPGKLKILELCESKQLSLDQREDIIKQVARSLHEEEKKWFAMRLRPKVKYETILERFGNISNEIKIPELFYPLEEIVKIIGRKIVWKGKPVIRDVVFFKSRRSDIYSIFSRIYDLAWCYRTPSDGAGAYASIPDKAMEDFKTALGILSPDFEVFPSGEMELRPGDEVVIVNGDYANSHAKILKSSSNDEEGHTIYRVTLLNSNGHWDIGIDARLLKKV